MNTDKKYWIEAALQVLEDRQKNAEKAMRSAQESANEETKSSAGDKYETARAMSQLERDMHARQLDQVSREIQVLKNLNLGPKVIAESGALITTDQGMYLLSIGLGKIERDQDHCVLLSPASPLGKVFSGKKAGDTITWNAVEYKVEHIN